MTGRRRERWWSGELRWTGLHTAAAAWTAGGLVMSYLNPWLWDVLWAMLMAVWLAYALVGAALILVCLGAGAWRGWTKARVTAAAMVVLGGVLVHETSTALSAAADGRRFARRFERMAPRYERIVKELAAARQVPERGSSGGVDFVVDAGPPRRVAFPQPGGIIDNWEGVIHDPSRGLDGAVPPAGGVRGGFSPPPELVRVFGGSLLACRPVRDHFYRCWFT